jgi:UDP:flavonoid glycosyltransferase YjiC (YdhE family)
MSASFNFLLACWYSPGNLGPLLTAARRLRRRGHNVRFIAYPELQAELKAAGFSVASWRRAPSYSDLARASDVPDPSDPGAFLMDVLFAPAAAYADDTRDELDRAPTDALLAHDLLLGAAMAAEAAGVPCAMLSPHISLRLLPGLPPVGSGLMPPRTPEERAEVNAASSRFAAVMNEGLPILNGVRARRNLDPLDHVFDQYDRPERVLLAISSAFDFRPDHMPRNVRYVGPLLDPPGWSWSWQAPWPQNSVRPRALVSFSTTFQGQADPIQRVINALGGMAVDAVVTTGPALVGTVLRAPENVTLLHSAPHDAVMEEVSLVVTHGGHGTLCRALAHGLPLLVVPMGRDQNDNALRLEAHGAGLSLPPTASEAEIAAGLNRLIAEPRFRLAARRLGEAIAPDLGSDALVKEMEAIAASGRADQIWSHRRVV